jgi:hypothetical protein
MVIDRLFRQVVVGRRRDREEFAGAREAGLARRSGPSLAPNIEQDVEVAKSALAALKL